MYILKCAVLIIITLSQPSAPTVAFTIFQSNLAAFSSFQADIRYLPQNLFLKSLTSNDTFSLVVTTKLSTDPTTDSEQQVSSKSVIFSQQDEIYEVIYNLQPYAMTITLQITYKDNYYLNPTTNSIFSISPQLTQNYNQQTLTKANMTELILESFIIHLSTPPNNQLEKHFLAIIEKDKLGNFMLPFNLINLKKYRVFVNYVNSTIESTQYLNEPFLPTFWNQLDSDTIIVPWLPYFSECQGVKKRIMLKDLLKPSICHNQQDDPKENGYSFLNPIRCEPKTQFFTCLIEQYNVKNMKRNSWFDSFQEDIFYFHPQPISTAQLQIYLEDITYVNDNLQKKMYEQRPALCSKNIKINQKPKQFVFNFKMSVSSTMNIEIISVQLQINAQQTIFPQFQSLSSSDTSETVSLVVVVDYFNQLQKFYFLHMEIYFYIIVPVILTGFAIILNLTLRKSWKMFRSFQIQKLVSLMIVPMLKGLLLSILTTFSFICLFYLISETTSFSLIATTFNGDDSIQSNLQKKYNGRNGLVLIFSGFFILIQIIKQTFKIPTPEEMKISIEDAQQQSQGFVQVANTSQRSSIKSQTNLRQLNQQDINFSIKILQSKRNKLFVQFIYCLILFLYYYKLQTLIHYRVYQVLIWIFVIPLFITLAYKIQLHIICKDLIYPQTTLTIFLSFSYSILMLKSDTALDLLINNYLSGLSFAMIMPLFQLKLNQLCVKLYAQENPNKFEIFLLKRFKRFIRSQANLTPYQKGLYFAALGANQICSVAITPFILLLLYWSFQQSKIFSDIFVNSQTFKIIAITIVLAIPSVLIYIFWVMQWFDKFYEIGVIKTIQLNQFTFKNRKVKWMSDIFRLNPTIADYFREYEKFHFSSQLYYVILSMSFAGVAIMLGIKIIFQNKYICFVDPAMMFILAIVWIVGDILAMIISFLALKFKFYEKKEQVRMRTKLQSIQKLLRTKDYTKYLNLTAVKEHFLFNYKDWVIKNIEKIFTKDMFLEDNGKILKKFKFYKNLLKRKNIMKKRNSIAEGNLEYLTGSNSSENQKMRNSQKQLDYEVQKSDDPTYITINGVLPKSKQSKADVNSNGPKVIKISKQKFNDLAKPLLYYWFYTAKQNTLLKSLIHKIKQEKLQQVCEFCNMDLDLENIQKHDIQQIINQFRVINVGKRFLPDNFVEYYRTHQQFITVCFQCKQKKLYLQKKRIKNIKYAKIIMMNWLIRCRSQLLHPKQCIESNIQER